MQERVEFPSPDGRIGLAVGGNMFCRFVIRFHLCFGIRVVENQFELGIRRFESRRVPFLARRLVLLVVFNSLTVEYFAGFLGLIEIAVTSAIKLSVNLINGGCRDNLGHKILVVFGANPRFNIICTLASTVVRPSFDRRKYHETLCKGTTFF